MSVTDEDMRNEMYTDKHGNGQTERDRDRQTSGLGWTERVKEKSEDDWHKMGL